MHIFQTTIASDNKSREKPERIKLLVFTRQIKTVEPQRVRMLGDGGGSREVGKETSTMTNLSSHGDDRRR
jgi:hypothetical protein